MVIRPHLHASAHTRVSMKKKFTLIPKFKMHARDIKHQRRKLIIRESIYVLRNDALTEQLKHDWNLVQAGQVWVGSVCVISSYSFPSSHCPWKFPQHMCVRVLRIKFCGKLMAQQPNCGALGPNSAGGLSYEVLMGV